MEWLGGQPRHRCGADVLHDRRNRPQRLPNPERPPRRTASTTWHPAAPGGSGPGERAAGGRTPGREACSDARTRSDTTMPVGPLERTLRDSRHEADALRCARPNARARTAVSTKRPLASPADRHRLRGGRSCPSGRDAQQLPPKVAADHLVGRLPERPQDQPLVVGVSVIELALGCCGPQFSRGRGRCRGIGRACGRWPRTCATCRRARTVAGGSAAAGTCPGKPTPPRGAAGPLPLPTPSSRPVVGPAVRAGGGDVAADPGGTTGHLVPAR